MKLTLLENRPGSWAAIVAVLVLFVGVGSLIFRHADGQDLASSYVGSRLLAKGEPQHLFSHDSEDFSEIGEDDEWTVVAHSGGFTGFLHPYVQTPLWAYALQPLARRVRFITFNHIFVVLNMLTFAGALWLIAKYWARSFFNPLAISLVILALVLSQPFQYAIWLNQTHMLMLFLTVAALVLAERDWPIAAGFLLAYAASVKVTPGLLVVYWLVTRRYKAAASTVVWSGVLWALTLAAVGHGLVHEYVDNLHRISRILLLSQNNQSFAAWVMAHFYPFDEVFDITILPLPTLVRLGSLALMIAFTAWGGWLDWQRGRRNVEHVAPLGAMMAMLAATIFAPIAWTHYAIVLFMPMMMLADANKRLRAWWVWALLGVALVLDYRPLATDILEGLIGPYSIIRGQFYSCVLTLLALALVAVRQSRQPRSRTESLAQNRAVAA